MARSGQESGVREIPSAPFDEAGAGDGPTRAPRQSSTLRIARWSEHSEKERPMHFILFVLIGLIAGALAGRVVSGHGYGMLGDLIVGVVGAFLGGWLFAVAFGVVGGGFIASLLIAFVGAVILLWVIRLVAASRA